MFILLLSGLISFATEVDLGARTSPPLSSASSSSSVGAAIVELNGCKPQKDLAQNKTEENFARQAAEKNSLSKEEILARLIYSESLSTGYWKQKCQANSEEDVMKAVGWGIMNRIQVKLKNSLDAYPDIIFAKSQFRTSFSDGKTGANPFAVAFLCPLQGDIYLQQAQPPASAAKVFAEAREVSHQMIEEYERSGIPSKYKGITNFFYPRSEFFGNIRPKTWATNPDPTKNKGYINILNVAQNPCVEAYHNP